MSDNKFETSLPARDAPVRHALRTPLQAAGASIGVSALNFATRHRAWFALFAAGLLIAGCKREPEHPNVVIITFDTTRADHIGTYGMPLAHTPTIDRLAAEGVRFDDAIASAPITAVSHSTIMTGLLPPAHGVRDNGSFSLGEDAVTLAERFKSAGYDTQAFVSAVVLNRRYRLDQGFDGYDDDLWGEDEPKMFMIRSRPAGETVDRVLNWYKARGTAAPNAPTPAPPAPAASTPASDGTRVPAPEPAGAAASKPAPASDVTGAARKPFFLWVHFFDPHEPHHPPAWATATSRSSYDASIAYADRELGRLVDALRESGELDRTVFVFTADHGESLGEHQEKTHAIFVYRATTRVPLIVRYPPRFPENRPYAGPVRNVDIAPTLLSLAHLPGADQTQGVDLTPLAHSDAPVADLPQYSESKLAELGFGMAPLYSVRKGGFTFVRAPKPELYDLAADPGETNNLYGDAKYQAKADALNVELEKLMQDSAKHAVAAQADAMSKETMQALQSLGYLQGATDRNSANGIDPKDGISIYNKLESARHYAQRRKWVRAEHDLKEILAKMPNHFSARSVLAVVEFQRGHLDEAKAQYLALVAQDPKQFRLYGMLGQISLQQGKFDEAERYNNEALKVAPQFVESMGQLGLIAMIRGDDAAAQRWYDEALKIDVGFPTLHRRLADLYFERGDFAAALKEYLEAHKRQRNDLRSLLQAGASARRIGQLDDADRLLREAVAQRPKSWISHYNLGCLLADRGDKAAALKSLDEAIDHGMTFPKLLVDDADWDSVRRDPAFAERMARVNKLAAARGTKSKGEDEDADAEGDDAD